MEQKRLSYAKSLCCDISRVILRKFHLCISFVINTYQVS